MKLRLLSILFFCGLLIATGNAFGAAATISYTAPPVYSFGTLITTLTPTVTNAGSAPTYSISPSVTTNTGLTFSTTTGAISGTPSKISVAVVYTVTLTPGGTSPGTGTPTATVTITVTARVNNWTGGTAAWATTGNWSAGVVPTVNDSVRIGVVTFTNAPTISVAGALARAVTFGTVKAGTLTITSPGTLAVSNGIAINAGVTGTITGTGNITAGSATFTGAGSILTLTTIPLTVTNALTITAGATATITGTGSITAGSATFGTGSATSLTLTTIPLTVSNTLSINAGALATLTGTGSVSTKSLVFSGASASLTLTTLTLTATNDFTVNTGATATITGTGNVNIKPLAALNVVTTGVLTTNMTGKFTLKSDATGSASVGQILATSVVGTGKDSLRVERFITGGVGHRGYYLMSSPVYVTTVSSNNVYDMHYLARAGMYLTGTTGFDKSSAPSLYLYREDRPPINNTFTSGNFWGVSKFNNTNVYDYNLNGTSTIYNVPAGNGFMVFFRGNRTGGTITQETYTTFVSAPTVTLTAVGRLNAGQVTFHDWYRPALATLGWSNATANTAIRGYNLVGNPYASTIDWETYQTSSTTTGIYASANVGNTIYEYDPVSHVYSTYQKGGAKTGNATRYIVSGQGFYVQATVDSTEQLIFNESAKANAQNTGVNLFMSTRANMAQLAGPAPEAHLRLTLVADSVNHEDTYIGFNSAASTKYAFNEDAPYRPGMSILNLSSFSNDNVQLAINKLSFPTLKSDTVVLKVYAAYNGTYTLNMSEVNSMPAIYDVWLMDAFTKDSLDMRHNPTYAFNVNLNDASSYGKGRFTVIVRQNPALAVHLLTFTGTKATTGSKISWTTENEQNYTNFTVERSTDNGVTFTALGGFASSNQGTYEFLDTNPLRGVDMYRLKLVDLNGTITYSNVISLTYTHFHVTVNNNIRVYPNPVKNTLSLFISSANSNSADQSDGIISSMINDKTDKTNQYSITIVNNSGAVLKRGNSNVTTWQADVSNFMPGSYVIQVSGKNGKAVGQCVFIKL